MVGVPGKSKGCANCRKRKIRCDLTRPICARCTASKIQCDGYDRYPVFINRTATGIQKRRALEEVRSNTALLQAAEARRMEPVHATLENLTLGIPEVGTHKERHSLQFFREYSTTRLSGHDDQEFWGRLILQLGQSDVAIRHLIVAIGAIHEEWKAIPQVGRYGGVNASRFALAQCNRAIDYLTNQSFSSRPTLIILTSSILFATIELLQGRHDSAYKCLQHGLCLRREWRERRITSCVRDPQDNIIDVQIEPMFARYSRRAEQSRDMQSRAPQPTPRHFADFTDARKALNKIVHNILSSSNTPSPNDDQLETISPSFQQEVETWYSRFTSLTGTHTTTNTSHQRPLALLKIRYRMARIMAATHPHRPDQPLSQSESLFDAYDHDFAKIVQWSQTFLSSEQPPSSLPSCDSSSSTFSFDSAIVIPLSFTVSSCRHSSIRHSAMRMLRQNTRHEGFCNSAFVAFVLEHVIAIEESNKSPSGVIEPIERIRLLHLEYLPRSDAEAQAQAVLKMRILTTCPATLSTYERTETRTVPSDPSLGAPTSRWTMDFGRAYAIPTAWEILFD